MKNVTTLKYSTITPRNNGTSSAVHHQHSGEAWQGRSMRVLWGREDEPVMEGNQMNKFTMNLLKKETGWKARWINSDFFIQQAKEMVHEHVWIDNSICV